MAIMMIIIVTYCKDIPNSCIKSGGVLLVRINIHYIHMYLPTLCLGVWEGGGKAPDLYEMGERSGPVHSAMGGGGQHTHFHSLL